jgi:rubredoxin
VTQKRVLEPGVPLRLRCQACGHEWDFPWERGMLAEALVTRMKAYCMCPACGNRGKAKNKRVLLIPRVEALG